MITDFVKTLESDKERINELKRPEVIEQKGKSHSEKRQKRDKEKKSENLKYREAGVDPGTTIYSRCPCNTVQLFWEPLSYSIQRVDIHT